MPSGTCSLLTGHHPRYSVTNSEGGSVHPGLGCDFSPLKSFLVSHLGHCPCRIPVGVLFLARRLQHGLRATVQVHFGFGFEMPVVCVALSQVPFQPLSSSFLVLGFSSSSQQDVPRAWFPLIPSTIFLSFPENLFPGTQQMLKQ